MRWMIAVPALLAMWILARGCDEDVAMRGSAHVASNDGYGAHSMFYDDLTPYGRWVEYGDYGYCWTPASVSAGWRPYTVGSWAYTDDGWYWASDEPWGWATYHYGRWVYDEPYGWIWIPDDEWGSSWVAWRYSDDYVGWAPLAPTSGFFGVSFSWSSGSYSRLGSDYWCFVPTRYFLAPRVTSYIVPVTQNVTIIEKTNVHVRYDRKGDFVRNVGIDERRVERWTDRPLRKMAIRETDRPQRGRIRGSEIPVYRPAATRGRGVEPVRERDRDDARIDRERSDRGRDDAQLDRERNERAQRDRENARVEREQRERNERAQQNRENARIEREQQERNERARQERENDRIDRERAERAERGRRNAEIDRQREAPVRQQQNERQRYEAERRQVERAPNVADSRRRERQEEVRAPERETRRKSSERNAQRNDREREEKEPNENRGRKR